MKPADSTVAHRLLAPRLVAIVGTRDSAGGANLAPISNVTSASRDPQVVVVAVYKEWKTYQNLLAGDGFTLSIPRADQLDAVWRLGEKYSGFEIPPAQTKIEAANIETVDLPDWYGPILSEAVGSMNCGLVRREPHGEFDHGLFFGKIQGAAFDERDLDETGSFLRNPEPLMQVTGNIFSTSAEHWSIPYFDNSDGE